MFVGAVLILEIYCSKSVISIIERNYIFIKGDSVKKIILLIRKYISYAKDLANKNTTNYERFKKWMHAYIAYKSNESKFNPTYLPKYEQGQIIFVDFGCGIKHEFSYPHYAIVLNAHDRKKNDLLTVVPLTSKKPKHNQLKNWEHEIAYPIQNLLVDKVTNDFNLYSTKYNELRDKIIALGKIGPTIDKHKFAEQYSKLIEIGVNEIYANNKDIMEFADKMSKGSIVETNQIKTISKSRIIFPTKKSHPLYDIKIHPSDLSIIQYKLVNHLLADTNKIDITK